MEKTTLTIAQAKAIALGQTVPEGIADMNVVQKSQDNFQASMELVKDDLMNLLQVNTKTTMDKTTSYAGSRLPVIPIDMGDGTILYVTVSTKLGKKKDVKEPKAPSKVNLRMDNLENKLNTLVNTVSDNAKRTEDMFTQLLNKLS